MTSERTETAVNIDPGGALQVVETTAFFDDEGVCVARSRGHYRMVMPGDDYSRETARVQRLCRAEHTPTVVQAYRALVAAGKP